jgi:hypothetical protein
MPCAFGPFPGPRQTILGKPHTAWSAVHQRTASIVFKASAKLCRTFLPTPSFILDVPGDVAYASLAITHLENLPWLAGRGYNHYGLFVHDVICTTGGEEIRGKFLIVLWENLADPILSGREELGYSKLYAELHEHYSPEEASYSLNVAWLGTTFGTFTLDGLVDAAEGDSPPKTEFTPGKGILHYKYIPKTGRPGEADAVYATFSPATSGSQTVLRKVQVAKKASFAFQARSWEELPTLFHITSVLEGLKAESIVTASISWAEGASDLSEHRIVGSS